MALTAIGQIELDGLKLGRGTPYRIGQVLGLVGTPDTRTFDTDRTSGDGIRVGRDRATARTIEIGLTVVGPSSDQVFADTEVLAAAMDRIDTLDLATLSWWLPGQGRRWTRVRPRRFAQPELDNLIATHLPVRIQLVAPDPGLMALSPSSASATVADGQTSIEETVQHGGRGRAWPTVTITGPARNPRLTNSTVGRALRLDVDVPVGSELTIDVRRRRVLLDGVPQFETVRADNQWWQLAPGENTVLFSRSSEALTGASSTVEISWHDTWPG